MYGISESCNQCRELTSSPTAKNPIHEGCGRGCWSRYSLSLSAGKFELQRAGPLEEDRPFLFLIKDNVCGAL